MAAVGIRELRNKLSLYLKQVEQGRWIEVTNRARGRSLVKELRSL